MSPSRAAVRLRRTSKNGAKYDVYLPDQTATLASDLTAAGVNVHYQSNSGLGSILVALLPNLLFFALIGGLSGGSTAASASGRRTRPRRSAARPPVSPRQSTLT